MKSHLLSSGYKILAGASPLDPVWGVELRADDPRADDRCQWKEKNCSVRHFLPFAKNSRQLDRVGAPGPPSSVPHLSWE